MRKRKAKFEEIIGTCPLLEIACPRGEEQSVQCWLRVKGDFDPLTSFLDFCILDCARTRAERMRKSTVKFFN
jgi:hypothetical protein